jgi:hypothetical protein
MIELSGLPIECGAKPAFAIDATPIVKAAASISDRNISVVPNYVAH